MSPQFSLIFNTDFYISLDKYGLWESFTRIFDKLSFSFIKKHRALHHKDCTKQKDIRKVKFGDCHAKSHSAGCLTAYIKYQKFRTLLISDKSIYETNDVQSFRCPKFKSV